MNKDINLLYSKKQQSINDLTVRVKIFRWLALGTLFLVGVVSIILFVLLIASPLPQLKSTEQSLTTSLTQSHEKLLKQTLLSGRLGDISLITTKRSHYGDDLEGLRNELPAGSEITAFSVEKKDMSITVTSQSLQDLETYFDKLKKLTLGKKILSRAYLTSLEAKVNVKNIVTHFEAVVSLTLL